MPFKNCFVHIYVLLAFLSVYHMYARHIRVSEEEVRLSGIRVIERLDGYELSHGCWGTDPRSSARLVSSLNH